MTRLSKSDAQLDAEAAVPLEERDLDAAIAWHRSAYRADLAISRLHVRDGESGIGPPFAPPFANYLDQHFGAFPWNRALFWLRYRYCRADHPEHSSREEWDGALCYSLVSWVIRHEYSLDQARLKLGLAYAGRSRRTLDSALLAIEQRMDRQREYDESRLTLPPRTPAEWMAPEHAHLPLDGLHRADCRNPVCRLRRWSNAA